MAEALHNALLLQGNRNYQRDIAEAEQRGALRVLRELQAHCQTMADAHVLKEQAARQGGSAWEAVEHDCHRDWWLEAHAAFDDIEKMHAWLGWRTAAHGGGPAQP